MKRKDQKQLIIDFLKRTPIIQIACEKNGIARATYYRWRKEDKGFAKETDEAIAQGSLLINDLAESQLISAIKERDLTAVIFWLKNHHSAYSNKLELTGNISHDYQLTPEQEKLISQAISLITPVKSIRKKINK
jgi:ACT domain-containing protein